MNPKTTIGLVIALLIALGCVWWARSSDLAEQDTITDSTRRLFDPALGEVQAYEIVLTSTGEALRFELQQDRQDPSAEKKWRMTAPLTGPADHYMVSSDVDRIQRMELVRSYSPQDADRPTNEMTLLTNPLRIVKLTDLEGQTHVVRIGATQQLSTNTYVQKEGDETIYLAKSDLNAELRRGLSDYRSKRVIEFSQADVVRIEAAGAHRYLLVRSGSKWVVEQPQKARADAGKIDSLLTSLASLNAERFVDDKPSSLRPYGLENPHFAITVTSETRTPRPQQPPPAEAPETPEYDVHTKTLRLLIGATVEDSTFARIDDPAIPAVFQISRAVAGQIMQPLDELRDRKVADIALARAQRINLTSAAGAAELTSDNNIWKITSGLPDSESRLADFAAVDDILQTVRNMTAVGFETTELPTHGFSQPRAVVEMTFEGTVEPIRLVFGNMTPSETGVYVRNERENFVAVVKADTVDHFVASPASFLSRELLRVNPSEISRLDLKFPEWSCAVAKEDGAWMFVDPVQGAAETQAVGRILSNVSTLRGRKAVGLATDAAKFGLDKPFVTLALTVQSEPPSPETGDDASADESLPPAPTIHRLRVARQGESVYAMLESGQTICEVDPKILDDLKAELLDRRVAVIEPSLVRRLVFGGSSTMTFDRDGDRWQLEGEPTFQVDTMRVREVFEALRDLRADRYARYRGADLKEFGLDAPAITVTTESEDGVSRTLMISSKGPREGERYAAMAAQAGRVFVIDMDDVATFSRRVADFQLPG